MAIPVMAFKFPDLAESAAALRWARRLLLLQGRLRSNEPTQILVCASFGALVGALTAGLHWLIDWIHHVAFNISGDHSLSAGIGIDPDRILIVPALGGLLLGVGALVMRRYRPNDVVDPIEANALHGGRMSLKDSLRVLVATVWSNGSGVSVGMEAGYSQLGAVVLAKAGQYFRLRREDQRIFVAAGAGAAIAAAFNTPLAGAFYGYELILGGYSVRALAPIAAAALAATLALRVLMHPEVLFVVTDFVAIPQWFYLLAALAPGLAGHQAALMMVGMASVAAAIIGSPLTMVFLVLEGTGNFPVTIGVMVGVVIASTIVRLTFGYSFSTWRFHQRGIAISSPHDIGWLADLTVGRLMRTDTK